MKSTSTTISDLLNKEAIECIPTTSIDQQNDLETNPKKFQRKVSLSRESLRRIDFKNRYSLKKQTNIDCFQLISIDSTETSCDPEILSSSSSFDDNLTIKTIKRQKSFEFLSDIDKDSLSDESGYYPEDIRDLHELTKSTQIILNLQESVQV